MQSTRTVEMLSTRRRLLALVVTVVITGAGVVGLGSPADADAVASTFAFAGTAHLPRFPCHLEPGDPPCSGTFDGIVHGDVGGLDGESPWRATLLNSRAAATFAYGDQVGTCALGFADGEVSLNASAVQVSGGTYGAGPLGATISGLRASASFSWVRLGMTAEIEFTEVEVSVFIDGTGWRTVATGAGGSAVAGFLPFLDAANLPDCETFLNTPSLDAHVRGTATFRGLTAPANGAPGTPTAVRPAEGGIFATGEAQLFAVNATDPDGDPYHAHVVIEQGGVVVAEFDTAEAPSGSDSTGTPAEALPPGAFTWTAKAIDAAGNESGFFSPSRTVGVNRVPGTPSLVGPADDFVFPETGDQAFTVIATDPDGHPYAGEITVRQADTGEVVLVFSTAEAPSGQASSGPPPVHLPTGDYTWAAVALDDHGGESGPTGERPFSVAGDLHNVAPGAPALLSPADGATLPFGEPRRFDVRASDPNVDAYRATVTVRDATTAEVVATFVTDPAPSGQTASGRPSAILPVGSYRWSARATDLRGKSGPVSATRSFTVVPADP